MRASGIRAESAVSVDVQADSGAPSGAVSVARNCLNSDRGVEGRLEVDLAHPFHRIDQHLALQLALMGELDVTEVGTARAKGGIPSHRRFSPDVRLAVLTRLNHRNGLSTPKRFLRILGDARANLLPRDGVADKNDPPVVPRHRDSSVRNVGNVEFELTALHFTHPSSINS